MSRSVAMERTITEDMEAFIESVEKRPALYLKSLKEYSDINIKKKLWEEVCWEVVSGWAELEPESKRKIGAEVQQKWLNLRTCFSRELKAQQTKSGQAAKKRRVYRYFEKLLFLKSSLTQRPTESNTDFTGTGEDETEDNASDTADLNTVARRPKKSNNQNRNPNVNFQESLLNILKDNLDEDKHFALSLVPTLQSLNENEKFQAKIEILQLFQRIKANRTTTHLSSTFASPPTSNFIQPTFRAPFTSGVQTSQHNLPTYKNNYQETTREFSQYPRISPSPHCMDNSQSYLTDFTSSPQSPLLDL